MYRNEALTAVILDLDGTLVDSNDAHAMAWLEALREAGFKQTSFERIRPLIGLGTDRLLPHAAGVSAQSTEGRHIVENRARIFSKRYLPGVRPFPNVRQLLERMKRQGLKLVVATSAGPDEALALLWVAGVPDLLDDAVTGSDVARTKPDPDLIELALSQCGCPRESVLMLADTPYDIEAGRRARVSVVALRCGGWADAALAGAVAIYKDPKTLVREYSRSVFFPAAVAAATPYASPSLVAMRLTHRP